MRSIHGARWRRVERLTWSWEASGRGPRDHTQQPDEELSDDATNNNGSIISRVDSTEPTEKLPHSYQGTGQTVCFVPVTFKWNLQTASSQFTTVLSTSISAKAVRIHPECMRLKKKIPGLTPADPLFSRVRPYPVPPWATLNLQPWFGPEGFDKKFVSVVKKTKCPPLEHCLSVSLSVMFVYCVETKLFSVETQTILPSGRPNTLVFLQQTLWQYSVRDPLTRAKIIIFNEYLTSIKPRR